MLPTPETVTITVPGLVIPLGAVAVMLVELHAVTVTFVPLMAIVLAPCVEPNPDPVTVKDVPMTTVVGGLIPVRRGPPAAVGVNAIPIDPHAAELPDENVAFAVVVSAS